MNSVAHFGPNPISVEGMGDVTLSCAGHSPVIPVNAKSPFTVALGMSGQRRVKAEAEERQRGKLTMHNVNYIPAAGINLISWSQLKRAKGLSLTLVGNEEGGLSVVRLRGASDVEEIMRFRENQGLYWLVRGTEG